MMFRDDRAEKKEPNWQSSEYVRKEPSDCRRINYSFHGETVYPAASSNPGVKNLCTLEFNLLLVVGRRAFEFSGRWHLDPSSRPKKTAEPAKSWNGRDAAPSKVSERLKRKDHQWRRAFGFGCLGERQTERGTARREEEGRGACAMRRYGSGWRVRRRRRKGETRFRKEGGHPRRYKESIVT
ncbi:hypothetical protein K0M31_012524 [Melipona bicolor]|uniref:Uncharacterized protein n=1 Tax=Melipona bicolor TaxID=60889 RepID=A0AA40KHI1_9HYME|nr:hypothetical protein K0M31_012524 [Melipona bicolor]